MSGFYLYCVREKQTEKFTVEGLYKNSQAFALPVRQLEAIVSQVPLDQLGQEQIKHKAQEDLEWIKEMAQRHESVIEQAMRIDGRINPVIPMRFGTIFRNPENVAKTLTDEYRYYTECLAQLSQKQEWSVKLYLSDRTPMLSEVIEKDPMIIRKKNEIEAMPKGMAYFFKSQLDDLIQKCVTEKTKGYAKSVWSALNELVCQSLQGNILEKEVTGRAEPMILNAIFLINEKKIEAFKNTVVQLHSTMKSHGFQIEMSGPWPPYHFIKECHAPG